MIDDGQFKITKLCDQAPDVGSFADSSFILEFPDVVLALQIRSFTFDLLFLLPLSQDTCLLFVG